MHELKHACPLLFAVGVFELGLGVLEVRTRRIPTFTNNQKWRPSLTRATQNWGTPSDRGDQNWGTPSDQVVLDLGTFLRASWGHLGDDLEASWKALGNLLGGPGPRKLANMAATWLPKYGQDGQKIHPKIRPKIDQFFDASWN